MKIKITGLCGEGKSTIATLIEKALVAEGFTCFNYDFLKMDEDEQCFHNKNFGKRLSSVKEHNNVIDIESANVRLHSSFDKK